MSVRVSCVYATAPRSDRNCSNRSWDTMLSLFAALTVGCVIGLRALQYSIWSSVIANVWVHCRCRTPQLVKLFQSRMSLPNVPSRCCTMDFMTWSSPVHFRSSTCIAIIATNLLFWCSMSNSSSVRVGTSLHLLRVIWANLRWKHLGASTEPVAGLRLCNTSFEGSKVVYPGYTSLKLLENGNTWWW